MARSIREYAMAADLTGAALARDEAAAAILSAPAPIEQFRDAVKAPPVWETGGSWRYILGTDGAGRDMLSRLIYGARVSLFIGLAVMSVSFVLGGALGLIAAMAGPVA